MAEEQDRGDEEDVMKWLVKWNFNKDRMTVEEAAPSAEPSTAVRWEHVKDERGNIDLRACDALTVVEAETKYEAMSRTAQMLDMMSIREYFGK